LGPLLTDPQFVKNAARKFRPYCGGRVRGGKIAAGWAEVSELTPVDRAGGSRMPASPPSCSPIDGDRLLKASTTATAALARAVHPVIASGGVGSIADIDAPCWQPRADIEAWWWAGPV
jgi:phosphoribosylformimino-5-aminoimidazole carboxamide ribonucleotide (ProFAR) isomerase